MTDAATQTMIDNLPKNTGHSLDEWFELLRPLNLEKHGDIMKVLKGDHQMTHGYANLVSNLYRQSLTGTPDETDLVEAQYQGAKADLKPIYDAIVTAVSGFGNDVEIAPKKTSVSLRRSKQFALVTAATKTRVDLGLNLKGEPATERLKADKGMCTHKVALSSVEDVDTELIGYLQSAYDRA